MIDYRPVTPQPLSDFVSQSLFGVEAPARLNTLSEAERMELIAGSQKTCAKEARDVARRNPAHEYEDLLQEALLACVIAARRWSPTQGTKFNTFATSTIRNHLANIVTARRGEAAHHIEGWDAVVQPDRTGVEEEERIEPLTEEQRQALSRIGEPAATVVTLLVVHKLSPDQVATQLDRPEKDIKLIARNAAKALPKNLHWAYTPGLFDEEDE